MVREGRIETGSCEDRSLGLSAVRERLAFANGRYMHEGLYLELYGREGVGSARQRAWEP
jgi:hypothetical protein